MATPQKIWAIYYKSLTWFKAILGGIPLLNLPFGVTNRREQVVINCPDKWPKTKKNTIHGDRQPTPSNVPPRNEIRVL